MSQDLSVVQYLGISFWKKNGYCFRFFFNCFISRFDPLQDTDNFKIFFMPRRLPEESLHISYLCRTSDIQSLVALVLKKLNKTQTKHTLHKADNFLQSKVSI